MSNKAQVIHNLGPPNSMKWQDWPLSYPKVGEVRLRHTAIGVNFADTYHRAGISHPWPVSKPPVVIGFIIISYALSNEISYLLFFMITFSLFH